MAEDMGDKTEAATPRRREEAREQGQIARSPDLTAAAMLLGFLLLMHSFGAGLLKALKTILVELLSADSLSSFGADDIGPAMLRTLGLAAGAMAPLLGGALLIAVLVNVLQTGWFLSLERLQPKFSAIDPLKGLGKIFRADGAVGLLMNCLKLTLVGLVAWSAVRGRLDQIVGAQQLEFQQAFAIGASIVYSVGLRIAILLLVLAVIDYAWRRYQNERELMMTKQEIKEEMRRMDGDPKIKQRRRQIAMQMASKRLRTDVPKADVIVTNPTHFAIALQYDEKSMTAPRVVAKGADLLAQRIREIAIEHGIPIIERKPLARALYKMCQVGQEIPEQFYSAVAEILAYVYELSGKARQRQTV